MNPTIDFLNDLLGAFTPDVSKTAKPHGDVAQILANFHLRNYVVTAILPAVSLAPTEAKAEIVIRVFRQYADFLKSKMYRNDRLLVTCSDCHDMHGNMPYPRWLIHDPNNAASPLCQRCHTVIVLTHMETKLNARMKGELTRCIDCHMPGTAHTGVFAGDFGRMIKTPPYASAQEEEANAYWQSPMRSHVFDVPLRTNVAVDGVPPGRAMPIPYTAACGTCHLVNELQFK